jgi:hypothetical protein
MVPRTKQEILVDAPFSSGEFEKAWVQLCAFELEKLAWIPSATMLSDTWKSFMSAAILKGMNVGKTRQAPFKINDVLELVEEDGQLGVVLEAMLINLKSEEDSIDGCKSLRLYYLQK